MIISLCHRLLRIKLVNVIEYTKQCGYLLNETVSLTDSSLHFKKYDTGLNVHLSKICIGISLKRNIEGNE